LEVTAPGKDTIEEDASATAPMDGQLEVNNAMTTNEMKSDFKGGLDSARGDKRGPSSSSKEDSMPPQGNVDDMRGFEAASAAGQAGDIAMMNPDEKRSMRPKTARQRPPKVKDNVHEVDAKDSGKGGPKTTVVIMREGSDADKGDEVEEEEEDRDAGFKASGPKSNIANNNQQHGKLVQNIMKEQRVRD